MFGPNTEQAVERYKQANDDPEVLGVFMLMGATERWIEKFRVAKGEAIGYDAKGDEIVRVPLKEPVYIRAALDQQRLVYRHNTP